MAMSTAITRGGVLAGVLLATVVCGGAVAAEDATVKAFATWHGEGHLIVTGPAERTFVGMIIGAVYAETEKGPVRAGQLVCPAMVRVNAKDGSQTGTGRCTVTGGDGSQAFADVACKGVHLVGCKGDFTFTGGSGRFEGISGGGAVTIRSEFAKIEGASKIVAEEEAIGIMFWPALHYTLP